jgi:hypothetical protein
MTLNLNRSLLIMLDFSSQQKKNLLFEKDKENGRKLIDESSTRVCLDFSSL